MRKPRKNMWRMCGIMDDVRKLKYNKNYSIIICNLRLDYYYGVMYSVNGGSYCVRNDLDDCYSITFYDENGKYHDSYFRNEFEQTIKLDLV